MRLSKNERKREEISHVEPAIQQRVERNTVAAGNGQHYRPCPRLTPRDIADCERRVDLLSAKIQNLHWVDRVEARRLVLAAVAAAEQAPNT